MCGGAVKSVAKTVVNPIIPQAQKAIDVAGSAYDFGKKNLGIAGGLAGNILLGGNNSPPLPPPEPLSETVDVDSNPIKKKKIEDMRRGLIATMKTAPEGVLSPPNIINPAASGKKIGV